MKYSTARFFIASLTFAFFACSNNPKNVMEKKTTESVESATTKGPGKPETMVKETKVSTEKSVEVSSRGRYRKITYIHGKNASGKELPSLKPTAEHVDSGSNPYNTNAFNRPAGNDIRSAINGDANNPKTPTVVERDPSSVREVILNQMVSKDDDYARRISTVKEREGKLTPASRQFVDLTLQQVDKRKKSFDSLLTEFKKTSDDKANGKNLTSKLNIASAELDRKIRQLESKSK